MKSSIHLKESYASDGRSCKNLKSDISLKIHSMSSCSYEEGQFSDLSIGAEGQHHDGGRHHYQIYQVDSFRNMRFRKKERMTKYQKY